MSVTKALRVVIKLCIRVPMNLRNVKGRGNLTGADGEQVRGRKEVVWGGLGAGRWVEGREGGGRGRGVGVGNGGDWVHRVDRGGVGLTDAYGAIENALVECIEIVVREWGRGG